MSGAVRRGTSSRAPTLSRARALLLGAVLLAAGSPAPAAGEADDARSLAAIPLPPAARSRAVATDIVQNGQRLSIATLEPAGSLDETLDFYRTLWAHGEREGMPGYVENALGDWSVISRLDGGRNLVVQLRASGRGVEGFVSVMRLEPLRPSVADEAPPLPPGGRLLSATRARDLGRPARTFLVASTLRPGELAGFYRDALAREGWRVREIRAVDGPPLVLFERPGARAELVASDDGRGGSVAVLNTVGGDD